MPAPKPHDHTPQEERANREAALDRTIEGSFPASDPPSSNPNPDDPAALERREVPRGTGVPVSGTAPGHNAER